MRVSQMLLMGLACTSLSVLAGETEPASPEGVPITFSELDVDGNGLISHEEAEKSSDLVKKFAVADANSDGALSTEEFAGVLMADNQE